MDIARQFSELTSSPDKILAALNRYAPPLVSFALIALMAWLLASATWQLVPRGASGPVPIVDAGTELAAAAAPIVNVQGIVGRHLFGDYQAVAVVDEPAPGIDDAEVTNLPLSLLGTLAANSDEGALAIIEEGGEANVFAIGDTITRGAVLKSVTERAVFFTRAGKLERLDLPRENSDSPATARRSTRPVARTSRQKVDTPLRESAGDSGAQKLGDFIRPQPVFADGKQRGYRVYPGRKREQFAALGLKPGDLVTEINGTPLDDPSRGLEVFRSISSASQVSVTIERNGSPTSLVLDTSQLSMVDGDE